MTSVARRVLAGTFALVVAVPAWAQNATGTISGRVTDRQSQRPLGGVVVRIVGTQRGAQTDDAGQYRIPGVPAGSVQLVAQRIGYGAVPRTVSVKPAEVATVDFDLPPAAIALEQVVVTATGQSERKRENGVSTATIDNSAVNKAAVSTLSDVLSSRAPGVVVQQAAGETGAGARVRIRGSNSIALSNDPLLIIDGVRVDNSSGSTAIGTGGQQPSRFNDINPEEIENIEVIKGPAAAAMYGTAAANGVIQVTTKKGRAGKTHWDTFGELGTLHDINTYPSNYRSFGHTATNTPVTNCNLASRTSLAATEHARRLSHGRPRAHLQLHVGPERPGDLRLLAHAQVHEHARYRVHGRLLHAHRRVRRQAPGRHQLAERHECPLLGRGADAGCPYARLHRP